MHDCLRALIIPTGTIIEPFGDPVGETLILDRPLRDWQREGCQTFCTTPETISGGKISLKGALPALLMHDTFYASTRLLQEFVEKASRLPANGPVQLWLKKGLFTRLLAVLQDTQEDDQAVSFPLWYMANPSDETSLSNLEATLKNSAQRLVIDVDEESYEGNFPPHMIKKDGYRFCVTSRPAISITHPLHLALANMAANFARLAELKKMNFWGKLCTLAKARSLTKFRILSAVSRIHPEAEVHPTAVIEGSIVEKGAKIGAYAVVRFSYVGEKAFIDDHVGLKFSVVGREAYIANNCVLFFSVAYPRAFLISGPFQFTLFGYDTAMMNAIPADYRLDGQCVSIPTKRGVLSTGLRFVGSVIGHRTKVAAGIIIAPGRLIPNDLILFPDPGRVLQSIPADLSAAKSPYFLINGKLCSASEISSRKESRHHEPGNLHQTSGSHSGISRGIKRQNYHESPNHRRPRQ